MLNINHCFVPKAAAIMQPLFASTKGKPKMVEWSQDMLTAFLAAKHALAAATLLVHPHASAPTSITVVASNIAVCRVLEQLLEDRWQPSAFFNRQLHPLETRYRAFDWELLAFYLTIHYSTTF